MAVYTEFSEEALKRFLAEYDLGTLVAFQGIAEGVENSNFLLTLSSGTYILTVFEKRMKAEELPWFLGLMQHLSKEGVVCPLPVNGADGEALRRLVGKPAVITTFLQGRGVADTPTVDMCRQVGHALATLHNAGQSYDAVRPNALSADAWAPLLARCSDDAGEALGADFRQDVAAAVAHVVPRWPEKDTLPTGQIHADLFPDNVFFQDGSLSGLIDFYFACTDMFAYDVAICLNAWCFDANGGTYQADAAAALVAGYEQVRPLTPAEHEALPILCQGAALRFVLTRFYDWINTPADALVTRKDPRPYMRRFHYFYEAGRV